MTAVMSPEGPDAGLTWHYGDPLGEQRALADGAGVVDLSNREVVALRGPDGLDLLNRMGSARLAELAIGQTAATYLLDAHGRLAHYLALVRLDPTTVLGWTEPGRGAGLVDYLNQRRFRLAVTAELVPALTVVWQGTPPADQPYRAGLADCLGGYESFVPRADLAATLAGARPAGSWAYTARRIAAGRPRFGIDTDERTIPNELGVPSDEVALDKGCYPGQEAVAKVYNLGRPPRRLVRLQLDGSEERWLDPGQPIRAGDQVVGRAGSMAYHYELGPIALGLVDQSVEDAATVTVDGLAGVIEPVVPRHTERLLPPVTLRQRRRLL